MSTLAGRAISKCAPRSNISRSRRKCSKRYVRKRYQPSKPANGSLLEMTAVALKKRNGGFAPKLRRGAVSIVSILILWEIGRRFQFPFLSAVPAPTEVVRSLDKIIANGKFWSDWIASFTRVLSGFALAQLIGVPVGLLMAMNRTLRYLWFPPLEILRPIPPLAWVPTSIIFWPTTELSIIFVIFLGAFFTVVLNV